MPALREARSAAPEAAAASVCLGEPADVPAIRQAIAAHGGQLLDFTIEAEGLRVESRTTA